MRIRERQPPADFFSISSSPSSSSSYTSSVTAAHSLASSQDSSNSSSSFSPLSSAAAAAPRCRGLDLLVKAIHQVSDGSVVGVPYIQRRVTIRRRRRTHLGAFVFDGLRHRNTATIANKLNKPDKNLTGLSSRIQDSWRTTRRTSDPC